VSKSASFGCDIVKATSKVRLGLSTSTIHKSKTRAVVKTAISTSVAGVVADGKVQVYLDGKRLSTIRLKTDNKALASIRRPRIARAAAGCSRGSTPA